MHVCLRNSIIFIALSSSWLHSTIFHIPQDLLSIQAGIDSAGDGDTVLVDRGTYFENIVIDNKAIVVGSFFLTTHDTAYISKTIIDGSRKGRVVRIEGRGSNHTQFSGFTIRNGSTNFSEDGGGIYCLYSNPHLSFLNIKNNSASNSGGGISCHFANPILQEVSIINNQAIHGGGGISCFYSSPILSFVEISENSAESGGGMDIVSYSNPILNFTTISFNSAETNGGGIYLRDSKPGVKKTIIHGNVAKGNGGAVFVYNSNPQFTGSILTGNHGNFGVYVHTGNPSIFFSNLYQNEKGNFFGTRSAMGTPNTTNFNNLPCDQFYNIQLDPQFVDPENKNFHLKPGSPCIDSGDPDAPLGFNGSVSDIGVYESPYGRPKPNVPPTLADITDQTFLEDFKKHSIQISGVGSGSRNEDQELRVTAISDNQNVFPHPEVIYSSSDSIAILRFTSIPNTSGRASVTVKVTDDGGIKNGGIDSVKKTFSVTIIPVNDPPEISSFDDMYILENSGEQSVYITGIGSGAVNEIQSLSVSASSDNPRFIPDPDIRYMSPDSIAILTFIPNPDTSGTTVILIKVKDDGGTVHGGIDSIETRFSITAEPINNQPTLNSIADISMLEDSEEQVIRLTEIGPGAVNEIQTLVVTATSDNFDIFPGLEIDYSSPDSSGLLILRPVPDANGLTTVRVKVKDDGGTYLGGVDSVEVAFIVRVSENNDPPALNPVKDITILEDSEIQSIRLSGLSTGAVNEIQTLSITSISDNLDVIPAPVIDYTSPDSIGYLMFTPEPEANGTSTVKIIVKDDGGIENGGVDSVELFFTITITPVNDRPVISRINDLTILEDSGTQTVRLSGLGSGVENEVQTIIVSATSSDPDLLSDPVIYYISPNSDGIIMLAPGDDTNGEAMITVKVRDDGGTDNGGVDSVITSFSIFVAPVNDSPVLVYVPDVIILEDSDEQVIPLRGIQTGAIDEIQELTITASSYDHNIIPDPVITYSSPDSSGSLVFSPATNSNGTTLIRVKISDDGGTDKGGLDTMVTTFAVIVTPVNDPPFLESIDDVTVDEDMFSRLFLRASDIDNEDLTFNSPGDTNSVVTEMDKDTLVLTPIPNWNGEKVITVYVSDGELTDTTLFVLHVTPVNDPPSIEAIEDVVINEDSSSTIILAGSDIDGDQLFFETRIDTNDVVTKVSLDTLLLVPFADWNGEAVITVYVSDGTLRDTSSFGLFVLPVNDSPTEFSLLTPLKDDSLFVQFIEFAWHLSMDQDADTVEYILYLSGGGIDTIIPGLIQNSFSFDGRDYLPSDTTMMYTWFVQSTDGIDTVACSSQFAFYLGGEERIYRFSSFPYKIDLYQNQPNPFNAITTIRYDIPEYNDVNLVIFDLLGHHVKTLVSQREDPGYKSITWDGTDESGRRVSAGVYLYHIRAGDFMLTRKMVLLK